jgi:hypothetical protein
LPARTSPEAIPGTSAIRVGVALLAAFAFALSYDALRQMAVAIHVRGLLTYAFPLVIDGFIAIGVGALLMLRTAPLHSRIYVWTLVGVATVTSIWANALHAVRLNEQTRPDGLHLDNVTVGVLSAVAPLALAGAVHLYIVIRRHPTPHPERAEATDRHSSADHGHDSPQPTSRTEDALERQAPAHLNVAGSHIDLTQETSDVADVAPPPLPSTTKDAQKPHAVDHELLAVARTAPLGRGGRASRRHIEATIRGKGLSVSRADAETLKDVLQAELDETAAPDRQDDLREDLIDAP